MSTRPNLIQPNLETLHTSPIPTAFFRAMYAETGRKYHWEDMLKLSDHALHEYCSQPGKSFYTLIYMGAPAGFFVLDNLTDVVDINYFGLLNDVVGKGLGGKWLDFAICEAWKTQGCKKVTLNTCTLDHPSALPLYQSRGFEVTRTEDRPATK